MCMQSAEDVRNKSEGKLLRDRKSGSKLNSSCFMLGSSDTRYRFTCIRGECISYILMLSKNEIQLLICKMCLLFIEQVYEIFPSSCIMTISRFFCTTGIIL